MTESPDCGLFLASWSLRPGWRAATAPPSRAAGPPEGRVSRGFAAPVQGCLRCRKGSWGSTCLEIGEFAGSGGMSSNGGQQGARLTDKASVCEAVGVQERGGPRGTCMSLPWLGGGGGGEEVDCHGDCTGWQGCHSRGTEVERLQPGVGSRTHSDPGGGGGRP